MLFYTPRVRQIDPQRSLDFQRRVYSVSELSNQIRELLEGRYPDIWVEGELSNFKASAAGHLYFTLKDDRAQLAAVCFRNTARLLRFKPENGKSFRARGRITTYEVRGEYQLVVDVLEPAGLGALQLAFEQLKEKLEKEGLFRQERKRPLPAHPARVGIVTSPQSAALRDILAVLKRRHSGISVLVFPAEVQGDSASIQITEGIDYLSRTADVDVIIVTRGGGSIEDLWPFNEERVARAIVRSSKPVISAVGHEVDFTICDFVADLRAPTPSAAAEIVSRSKEEWIAQVRQLDGRLASSVRLRLSEIRSFVDSKVGSRGFIVAEANVRRLSQRVDELDFRMHRLLRGGAVTANRAHRSALVHQKLVAAVRANLGRADKQLAASAHKLNALSPLSVLERGYAICTLDSGAIVRSSGTVSVGDRIRVRLHEGTVAASITDKISEE